MIADFLVEGKVVFGDIQGLQLGNQHFGGSEV